MTTDAELKRIVRSWLEEGRTRLPDHVLDAVLAELPATPQRRSWRPAWRFAHVSPIAKYATAAAAVTVIAILGVSVLPAPGPGVPPSAVASPSAIASPTPSPSPSPPAAGLLPAPGPGVPPSAVASPSAIASPTPSPSPSPPAAGLLPALSLPGVFASPAGEYGWEGGPGSRARMHKVPGSREVTALFFAVGPGCLTERDGQEAIPVRVAGFDGVSVEPYEPPVAFVQADDIVTRAHALAVGDRTLCVFLTWHPTTTDDELAAAENVLDTIRAVPLGEDRIRITFTLDEGWDVG